MSTVIKASQKTGLLPAMRVVSRTSLGDRALDGKVRVAVDDPDDDLALIG